MLGGLESMPIGNMKVIRGEKGRLAGSSPDCWDVVCVGGHGVERRLDLNRSGWEGEETVACWATFLSRTGYDNRYALSKGLVPVRACYRTWPFMYSVSRNRAICTACR